MGLVFKNPVLYFHLKRKLKIISINCRDSRFSRLSFFRTRETSDKIETWEDLLEAGDKPPANSQAPWPGMSRGGMGNEPGARSGITRTSFLLTAKMVHGGMRQRYVQNIDHKFKAY